MKRIVLRLMVMTTSLLLITSPAHADDELGLSRDGSSWSSTLTGGLFDPKIRWVPGDERTATFYARNQSNTRGTMTVDVLGTAVDSLLETGDLTVSARAGEGDWTAISTPGRHRLAKTSIASGDHEKVDLRVTFAGSSPNVSEVKKLVVDLEVRLTQSGAVENAGGVTGDGENGNGAGLDGILPDTGSLLSPQMLLAAAALLMAGSWIIGARRRQEDDDE